MQPRAAVPKTPPGEAGARLAPDPGPARPYDLAAAQRPRIPDHRRAVPGLALGSANWRRMPRADSQATDPAAREHLMAVRFARFWAAALGYEFELPPEGFASWD